MMMVVKEPGLVAAVAQGSLNFGEIHGTSIVNELPAKFCAPKH
jgi:hypothetical protein